MTEKPPVDSHGKIIGDLPWKFFEPSRDTPATPEQPDPGTSRQ